MIQPVLFDAPSSNSAVVSDCGLFRYRLERDLGRSGPTAAIFGVNPSIATATVNDHTIRKDMGFGERLGWGRIIKGNKFAYRAVDVKKLRSAVDPVGPENNYHIEQIMRDADVHVVAWGPLAKLPRSLRGRWLEVTKIAERIGVTLYCWGVAGDGQPLHPLMLPYATSLINWVAPSGASGEPASADAAGKEAAL